MTEKVATGNPGKRPLTVTEFDNAVDLLGIDMPPPREFMSATQKNGSKLHAVEIYESTWKWLDERECVHLVSVQLIEQYAKENNLVDIKEITPHDDAMEMLLSIRKS